MRHMQSLALKDTAATLALGRQIAARLRMGDTLALTGSLGAGKTTLARGIIQALIGDIEVPSPTYTLVQIYETPYFDLWHCDMYRLEQPEDGYELGFPDAFDTAVVMIEWPDKLGSLMPEQAKIIEIIFDGSARIANLSGWEHDFE